MSCEHVEELLSAYLDNALTPQERVIVQEHTYACPACREILADYRRFDVLLMDLPRVNPSAELREKIFASLDCLEKDYRENTDTSEITSLHDFRQARNPSQELQAESQFKSFSQPLLPRAGERLTLPQKDVGRTKKARPHLVALAGGLQETKPHITALEQQSARKSAARKRTATALRIMQTAIAVCLLLTLGVGSFIGWNVLQAHTISALSGNITPPLGVHLGGPLPAGTRFVYLSNGALWSGSTDTTDASVSANAPARLTPTGVIVSSHWSVRPTFPGRIAGNMLAYIDLKQGRVHLIRSDGQSDMLITQPLFANTTTADSMWKTQTGVSILNSLAWSPDGSTLAFIAAPTGVEHLYTYKLDTSRVQMMPVSIQGEVQSLYWSLDANVSTITWSVGTSEHIHAIMQQQPDMGLLATKTLATGDFAQATYNGLGTWLLLSQGHDLFTLSMSGMLNRWTFNGSASLATWSSKGSYISYFSHLNTANSSYHLINLSTGSDTQLATSVSSNIAPAWSPDEQAVLSTDGTYITVSKLDGTTTTHIRLTGTITLLAWNPATPHQAIVALQGLHNGFYVLDTQHESLTQVSTSSIAGPILWTEIS